MQERFDVHVLGTALAAVKAGVGARMPYVRMDPTDGGVEIAADNHDLAIRATVPGWSPLDVSESRSVMVPYAPLASLVAKLTGDVEVVVESDALRLRCGKVDAALPLVDDSWFPRRPEAEGDEVTLDVDEWDRIIALTSFASGDTAAVTSGLHFDSAGVVATDAMALGAWLRPFDVEATVPAAAISALSALKGDEQAVTITIGERSCSIRAQTGDGTVEVVTSLIESAYPAYSKLLETKSAGTITVESADLRPAVERVAIASRPFSTKGRQMILRPIDEGGFELESLPGESQTGQRITEVVDATIVGVTEPFGINSIYFLGACDLIAGRKGTPTIHVVNPQQPLIWRSEDAVALNTSVRLPGA